MPRRTSGSPKRWQSWAAECGIVITALGLIPSLFVTDETLRMVCMGVAIFGIAVSLAPLWARPARRRGRGTSGGSSDDGFEIDLNFDHDQDTEARTCSKRRSKGFWQHLFDGDNDDPGLDGD